MPSRDELRARLLKAVENAEPEVIAKVVTRLLAQIEDATAERVVHALSTEISEAGREQQYDPVKEGKEMARKQIAERERAADRLR